MKQEECCMRPNKTSRAAIRICKADILESAPAFDRKEATAMNEPAAKQRHGCLTAYLMFILVANVAAALIYLFRPENVRQSIPHMPDWALPVLIMVSMINLICAVALFRWKRWGLWGFVGSAVIVFFLNLAMGPGLGSALAGLLGIAILFGVLHIGKERKGWAQLD